MDFRKPAAPGLTQMALGGEVLYDPGHPLSDDELDRRIKRALRNVGWKREAPAVPISSPAGPATHSARSPRQDRVGRSPLTR